MKVKHYCWIGIIAMFCYGYYQHVKPKPYSFKKWTVHGQTFWVTNGDTTKEICALCGFEKGDTVQNYRNKLIMVIDSQQHQGHRKQIFYHAHSFEDKPYDWVPENALRRYWIPAI